MGLVDHNLLDKVKDGVRESFAKLMEGKIVREDVVQQIRNTDDPLVERCNHHLERVIDRLDRGYQAKMMAAFGRFAISYAFLPASKAETVRSAVWRAGLRIAEQRIVRRDVVAQVRNSDDPLVQRANHHLERLVDRIEDGVVSRVVAAFGRLAIWIAFLDVAYRDQVIWMIWEAWHDEAFATAMDRERVVDPEDWAVNRDRFVWYLHQLWQDNHFAVAVQTMTVKPPEEWYANLHTYAEEETMRAQGDDPTDTGLGTESFFHMGEKRKRLEQHQYKQQADEREEGNG